MTCGNCLLRALDTPLVRPGLSADCASEKAGLLPTSCARNVHMQLTLACARDLRQDHRVRATPTCRGHEVDQARCSRSRLQSASRVDPPVRLTDGLRARFPRHQWGMRGPTGMPATTPPNFRRLAAAGSPARDTTNVTLWNQGDPRRHSKRGAAGNQRTARHAGPVAPGCKRHSGFRCAGWVGNR